MKKLFRFLTGVFIIFGTLGSAEAIQYTDTHDPTDFLMSSHIYSSDDIYSWTFDLTQDGFDPLTQDITSADMDLYLYDDSWSLSEIHPEKIGVYFDQLDDEGTADWEELTWSPGNYTITIESLVTLNDNGTLNVALKADALDFYFDKSVLTAYATDPVVVPVPNPEPTTMILFGLGLLGFAGVTRKKL